jgi:serine/threonine protein kinase
MFQMVQNINPMQNSSHRIKTIFNKNKSLNHFIHQCFKVKPSERPKAKDLLHHKFLSTHPIIPKKKKAAAVTERKTKGKKGKKKNHS